MTGINVIEKTVIRSDEREKAIIHLVDEIRSQQLSFFEEAQAILKLIEDCGLTQEEAAAKLGRVQSTIANKLRLLRLTPDEQAKVTQYNLTERHARALLRIASREDRDIVLEKIIDEELNVEKTEQLIDDFIGGEIRRQKSRKRTSVFRNMTVFADTINKAVEAMKSAGIQAYSSEIRGEDYIEYRVRIPVKK